jgi:hypothetical protein
VRSSISVRLDSGGRSNISSSGKDASRLGSACPRSSFVDDFDPARLRIGNS